MIELKVAEIRVAGSDMPPVVVLAEIGGAERRLPIWMSHGGAASILGATEEPDARRPSIHDLAGVIVGATGDGELQAVHLIDYEDGQFYAELVFPAQNLPARPSDALALALRIGCPIRCTESVLDACGVAAESTLPADSGKAEQEVERFLEFLDKVTPEDFSGEKDQP